MTGDRHYQDRVVRLHELVPDHGPPIIDGFTFDGCHILGPAVVGINATSPGSGSMEHCTFDGDPDGLFIQLAPDQQQISGAIELRDCRFSRCRFERVGILDKNRELRSRMEGK